MVSKRAQSSHFSRTSLSWALAASQFPVESAGVVLAGNDPRAVAGVIRLSRATYRKMRQNLAWAVGYNAVALPIAAGVFEPAFGLVLRPEIAALSMSGSSFLVAVNALMLKRLRLPQPPAEPDTIPAAAARPPTPVH